MAFASNAQFVSGRCSLNFTLVAALGFGLGLGSGLGFPIIVSHVLKCGLN